eukprot:scaffold10408_cov84-Isochrysis_galbana.AAC.1
MAAHVGPSAGIGRGGGPPDGIATVGHARSGSPGGIGSSPPATATATAAAAAIPERGTVAPAGIHAPRPENRRRRER